MKIKKLISVITLIAVSSQLINIGQINAAPLYDDVYDSGDIFIFADLAGTPAVERYSASNNYSKTTIQTGNSDLAFILFLPTADMVTYHTNFTSNELRCKTAISNYTDDCSWSGASGLNLNDTTPENLNMTIVDPAGVRATDVVEASNSEANPLIGEMAVNGAVSANGDIWLAHYAPTGPTRFGQYVSRVHAPDYDTVTLYDMSFGSCSNATYLNEQSCEDNAATWTDVESANVMDLAIDYFGDVWVAASFSELSVAGDTIYCLDSSNNFLACSGTAFDQYGGINVGGRPSDIVVDNEDDILVAVISGTSSIKKYSRVSQFLNPTSTITTNVPWRIAVDSTNKYWVHTETASEASGDIATNVDCFTSSLADCTTATLNYQKPGANLNSGIYIDVNDKIWLTTSDENGSDRLYCFNSNGTPCSTASPFINTGDSTGAYYIPTGDMSAFAAQWSDNTALLIKNVVEYTGGQDQVNVSATIDPVISLSLTSNECNLGTLSSSTIETCSYDVTVTTNATNGYTAYINAVSDLVPISGTNDIDQADGDVTPTTEEYGVSTSIAGQTITQTNTTCTGLDNGVTAMNSSNLLNTVQSINNSLIPVENDVATVCHAATISDTTAAGAYSHDILITAVGSF